MTKLLGGGGLVKLGAIIKSTIEDPKANLNQTLLVVGALFALILILTLVAFIAYFVISDRLGHKRKIVLPTRELTRREILISWGVFLLLLTGLYWSIDSYGARTSTCDMCHEQQQSKTLGESPHKGINCMACHQKPGLFGSLAQKIDYSRWILNFTELQNANRTTTGDKFKFQAEVSDQSCLRCHREVEHKVVSRIGVRMRHYDVIKAGYNCADCHNTVAHLGKVANPKRPSMDKCIACHNNKIASNDCKLCHTTLSEGQKLFTREHIKIILAAPSNCRGCHNVVTECTVCHGLEMPHSNEFKKKGAHAMQGFVNKDICWKCHKQYDFCNRCHQFPSPHGDSRRWLAGHGSATKLPSFAVFWPKVNELIKGCDGCHASFLCDTCHDDRRRPVKDRPSGPPHSNNIQVNPPTGDEPAPEDE